MLNMEVPGRRKRRFVDVVKENITRVGVTEEDTRHRVKWRKVLHCGNPKWTYYHVVFSVMYILLCFK